MMNLILAAALATAPVQSAPVQAVPDADPAIFVVRDGDTTIYLFGTFHALDGKGDWFNDQVKAAFESSNELILETLIPEAPPAHAPVMRRFSGPTLSATPSASFLGTTRMAINAGKAEGLSVGNGADMVLRRAADLAGKPVGGLETLESQLMMFSRMPAVPAPTNQAGAPKAAAASVGTPDAMRQLSDTMMAMQAAWKQGDQSIFVRMLDQLRRGSPATYQMMFTDRNSRWADWIAARMDTPGAVFVAVGAGHLAGKDSVLVRLAEMGFESRRLN